MCDWISVKDRLPDTEDDVLCIVSGRPERNIRLDRACLIGAYFDGEWYFDMFPGFENPQVKYWMPIPEPPKEDTE